MAGPSNYDLDYGEAAAFSDDFRHVYGRLKSPIFHGEVVHAFALNMERVASMFELAPYLIYYVARNTQIVCAAAAKLEIDVMSALDPAIQDVPGFEAEASRIRNETIKQQLEAGVDVRAERLKMGGAHIKRLIRRNVDSLSFLASDQEMRSVHFIGGVEAVLFSMVSSAYAAFETLAGDLWEQALNYNPRLALNWCKANNQDKTVTFDQLAALDFDLSSAMGSFLIGRVAGAAKARFDSVHDIRTHYEAAFGKDIEGCWDPVSEIKLASAVRNVISHRGGLIDQTFLKQVRKVPEYSHQSLDARLFMSGAMVCRHIDACTRCAIKLIETVDGWTDKDAKKTKRLGE